MAAGENHVWTGSYAASADLSTKQFFLVKRHTVEGQCAIVAAAADIPIGILQNKPAAAGRAAEVVIAGRSKAQVEATTDIAIGDRLGPDANGRLIKRTTDKDVVCAIAEQAATAVTGEIIEVTVFPAYNLSV